MSKRISHFPRGNFFEKFVVEPGRRELTILWSMIEKNFQKEICTRFAVCKLIRQKFLILIPSKLPLDSQKMSHFENFLLWLHKEISLVISLAFWRISRASYSFPLPDQEMRQKENFSFRLHLINSFRSREKFSRIHQLEPRPNTSIYASMLVCDVTR